MPDRAHGSAQPTPAHYRQPGCLPGFRSFSKPEEKQKYRKVAAEVEVVGPRRAAPMFYAGESYNEHDVQYPDVERYPNGALPSKRVKPMRRIIRAALKKTFSRLTKSLRLAQGLKAQAYEVARDEKRSGRYARRLLAKELAIHQTAYVPADLRALRTEKRKKLRKGLAGDAISELVDRMTKES